MFFHNFHSNLESTDTRREARARSPEKLVQSHGGGKNEVGRTCAERSAKKVVWKKPALTAPAESNRPPCEELSPRPLTFKDTNE